MAMAGIHGLGRRKDERENLKQIKCEDNEWGGGNEREKGPRWREKMKQGRIHGQRVVAARGQGQ